MRQNMTAIPHLTQRQTELFWLKVNRHGSCWIWSAYKNRWGYGVFGIGRKAFLAHRVVYAITYGDTPQNRLVCHTCDRPDCVNPAHLFLGTDLDNVSDMISKGRKAIVHPMIKICEEVIESILAEYIPGITTQRGLAKKYGVSKSYVSVILRSQCRQGITCQVEHNIPRPMVEELHPTSKLTKDQVIQIISSLTDGISQQELADKYGVDRKTISHIANCKTWKSIPRRWAEVPEVAHARP